MAKDLDGILDKVNDRFDDVLTSVHEVDKKVSIQEQTLNRHGEHHILIQEKLEELKIIHADNTASLKEHMRRTDALETFVKSIDARLTPFEINRIEVEAIEKYRNEKLIKYGKIFAIIATILGILTFLRPFFLKLLGV